MSDYDLHGVGVQVESYCTVRKTLIVDSDTQSASIPCH
jgi:hypothetical protein